MCSPPSCQWIVRALASRDSNPKPPEFAPRVLNPFQLDAIDATHPPPGLGNRTRMCDLTRFHRRRSLPVPLDHRRSACTHQAGRLASTSRPARLDRLLRSESREDVAWSLPDHRGERYDHTLGAPSAFLLCG